MLPLIALLVATSTTAPPPAPPAPPAPARESKATYDEEAEARETDPDPEEEDEYYYEYDPRDPKWLPYDEDVPPGYVASTRIRVGWLIAGAAVFVGLYGFTAFTAVSADADDEIIFLPGIGPIVLAAKGGGGETFTDMILVIDGVLQMTAVAVAIWAVADPKKLLLREDLAVTPFFLGDGGGLGVSARF